MQPKIVLIIWMFFLNLASAQSWRLDDPIFEQRNFLLTKDIQELNIDYALVWTDSLACIFTAPFDAVFLHLKDDRIPFDVPKDVIIISDAAMNRLVIFQCSVPEEGTRTIEKIAAYRADDIMGLKRPSGMATNAIGRVFDPENDVIYLADRGNDRILELTYTPDSEGGKLSCNRQLAVGMVESPIDVAIANYGSAQQSDVDLYILDKGHSENTGELVRIDLNNRLEGSWHSIPMPNNPNFFWQINIPVAVACYPDTAPGYEAIYISEGSINSIIKITSNTNDVPTFAMTHEFDLGGNYWKPGGLAFDDYGRIYAANEIKGYFELLGPHVSYYFGIFGSLGEGPGQFFYPSNIVIDTYHGVCEALIFELYWRQSGLQTYVITNGAAPTRMGGGFIAEHLVNPANRGSSAMPKTFALHNAYPNPFNSICRISYDLPKSCYVTIEVFNITGQKMAVLFSGEQDAGTHPVDFKANEYSSGVYFIRLKTDDYTSVKSVVLLK